MRLFWWLASGPLSPVFHHVLLAWLFLILYAFFGDVVRYPYLGALILLIVFAVPLQNVLKRLEAKCRPKHF